MESEILVSIDELEDRVAILEEGQLVEAYVVRGERNVGSIYKGKVVNVLPGMQAAFVDIGFEKNAFLCVDDIVSSLDQLISDREIKRELIQHRIEEREERLVQVVKEAVGTKGARITTNVTLPGKYLVLLPYVKYVGISRKIESPEERDRLRGLIDNLRPSAMGLIIRTAAEGKVEDEIKKDLDFLLRLWSKILEKANETHAPAIVHQELSLAFKAIRDFFSDDITKFIIDSSTEYKKVLELAEIISPQLKNRIFLYEGTRPMFDMYSVEQELDRALRKKVWLPSGGYLIIEKTEALTVIDVNTGKYVGTHSLADTILKTNLEASREIARQIRLRDISGIIIVDFIDMSNEKDREKIIAKLKEAFKQDRNRTYILGMTSLGLVEMTRKRTGKNLETMLRESCIYCNSRGRVFSPETMAIRIHRAIRLEAIEDKHDAVLVRAHPQVANLLADWEGEGFEKLANIIGKALFVRVEPTLHIEKFHINWDRKNKISQQFPEPDSGTTLWLTIEDSHPLNFQNGIGYAKGHIVEVEEGGKLIGTRVLVRINKLRPSYAMAQIVQQ